MTRRASTAFEQRIDFATVERAQEARHARTLASLRKVILKQQTKALGWAVDTLVKRKLKTAIPKFELDLKAKYRATLRQAMVAAAIRGNADSHSELGLKVRPLTTADLTRVRARADALVDDQLGQLEKELKRVWSQAVLGVIDRAQIEYLTKKTFAEFAGWVQPEAP